MWNPLLRTIGVDLFCNLCFRYLDNVEVFCPNDGCHGVDFAPFPYGVVGPVSAFVNGNAFVCGGSRSVYEKCRK